MYYNFLLLEGTNLLKDKQMDKLTDKRNVVYIADRTMIATAAHRSMLETDADRAIIETAALRAMLETDEELLLRLLQIEL